MRFIVTLASCLVAAGCAAGTGTAQPSGSATTSTPSSGKSGGPVAACVVGDWLSTDVSASASGIGGSATASGGKNVSVKIAGNGETIVDFTGMQPIMFSANALGTPIKGNFVHTGKATGQIRTGDAVSTSGVWEPFGTANWADVKVTVELTEPMAIKPFVNVPIRDLMADAGAGNQTGGVVDVDPLLGKGKYECGSGDTLILSPDDGKGVSWKLVSRDAK